MYGLINSILGDNQLLVREKKGWNSLKEEDEDHIMYGPGLMRCGLKDDHLFVTERRGWNEVKEGDNDHRMRGPVSSTLKDNKDSQILIRATKCWNDVKDDEHTRYGGVRSTLKYNKEDQFPIREKKRQNDVKNDSEPSKDNQFFVREKKRWNDVKEEDEDEHMHCDKKLKDRSALLKLIDACSKRKEVDKGNRILAYVSNRNLLQKDVFLCNALISMYVKCGRLAKAQEILDGIPIRNVISWNNIIAGYARAGICQKAFDCFKRMREEGVSPNAVTFTCILKVCGIMHSIDRGKEIHCEVTKKGLLRNNVVLGTALIDMYAKCGELETAREVLNQLSDKDVVSWTALIAGYVQHGFYDEALHCFSQMKAEGLSPNKVTFSCILKACSSIRSSEQGQEIHAELNKQGLLEKDIVLGTSLVDMYAKCGMLEKAQEVFDSLPVRNIICWTALITGYAQHELGCEALTSFAQMQREGFSPDAVTYACILKACGNIRSIEKGEEIHAEISKQGLLENDIVLRTALVDMYAKCGAMGKAQKVFDEIITPNVVCWNALISGYVQHELANEALHCFTQMRAMGLFPDAFTFTCILKACGRLGSVEKGQEIHVEVRKWGLLEKDPVLRNALVDMYAKCGMFLKAQEVFNELPTQNVVSWNVLITGYTQHGLSDEALNCFRRMRDDDVSPDEVTFACILKACGSIGFANKGKEIHAEINMQGLLGENAVLGTALVDMYAMCGMIDKAEEIFGELPIRDVISWNVLLSGYAQLGQVKKVFISLNKMLAEESVPDAITFVILLSACSLTGLVEEGQVFFYTMKSTYYFTPSLEHHTCMVNLFGHTGQLRKAIMVIENVCETDCIQLWSALLGSCQKHNSLDVGRWAFEQSAQLDKDNAAAYVCMSNIYAAAATQKEL